MKLRNIDFIGWLAGIIGLILSVAVLGAGVYVLWLLVRALQKYLAS